MWDLARDWPAPLRRVGAYELGRLIGRGGTAAVYEAVRATDGASAAVKILHAHLAQDCVVTARFVREGRTLAKIAHPNIVGVLDAGDVDGAPYLVMSLVEGEDLSDYLRRMHPMPLQGIVDCVAPVIDAVATAHEAGIIHRDLKPKNIRIKRTERGGIVPKLLDFGVSKWTASDSSTDMTTTGEALGTVSYMAPEQLRSSKRVDERGDIYALGVILYECASGVRPFLGRCVYELMHAVMTADVSPPSTFRPDLPSEFDAVVLRAMRRNPAERFSSARELWIALTQLTSSIGTDGLPRCPVPARAFAKDRHVSNAAGDSSEIGGFGFEIIRLESLDVSVWLAGVADFSDHDWRSACRHVANAVRARNDQLTRHRVIVVTDGSAPNTKQRREWSQLVLRGSSVRTAIVTTSVGTNPLKRGIATALQWLNREFRIFEPREILGAIDHSTLTPEEFAVIWSALGQMQRRMQPVRALALVADHLGLALDVS